MMSENSERPDDEGSRTQPNSAENGDTGSQDDPREALKRDAARYRLPPELKAQILAELPPLEERERLYRELQEQGGLSSEEFLASLDLEGEPQP
jgi:hypothetical protein